MSRRRRGADVSAAVRRAGSLSRGGNPRAGSGPPFPPRPRILSVCLCFAVAFSFLLSFASGSRFPEKLRKLYQKKPQKRQKIKIKSVNNINYYLFYYIAQDKPMKKAQDEHIKTSRARENFGSKTLNRISHCVLSFLSFCAFYFPFLSALALARRSCLSPLALSARNLPSLFRARPSVMQAYELLWWGVTFGPKGVIPYFWCYMPRRVSVGLMYVFSHVSHDLSGTLAYLVITDHRPLLSRQSRRPLPDCLPKREDPGFIIVFFARLPCFLPAYLLDRLDSRFRPGVGVDARLRLKQLPRRNNARLRPA